MYSREKLALLFDIYPTDSNLARIGRGLDILDDGGVRYVGFNGLQQEFDVASQGFGSKVAAGTPYRVRLIEGDKYPTCECADWRHACDDFVDTTHRCKHGIAVLIFQLVSAEWESSIQSDWIQTARIIAAEILAEEIYG